MAINGKSIVPLVATHPGSVLNKELKARGIKQKEFAEAIGMPVSYLSELIKGRCNVSDDIAIKLEQALGIPAKNWINLQARYYYVKKCHEERNTLSSKVDTKELTLPSRLNLQMLSAH